MMSLPGQGGRLSDDPPPVGSIHRGTVHAVKPFGVFVAIQGYRRHVLVHHTQVGQGLRFRGRVARVCPSRGLASWLLGTCCWVLPLPPHLLVHTRPCQVSEELVLTRGDEDELKVKALEYAAPQGQSVWVKVRRACM
jgi:hypothetical protein